ncbi:MAG: thioredoxin family protein [Planctomycetota bacterium]|nr:MAG: thioredoxin family protein [Planctomycetota bacterium]
MAATESTMPPLGTPAPDFDLPDTNPPGRRVALKDFADRDALVVMFLCNHCPFVKHIQAELASLARDYLPRGVGFVAISSNDVTTHPDDAPDKMTVTANEAGWPFPYLYDESQQTAKAFGAACTPDFFLYDRDRRLAYRGQLDDSRPGSAAPITGADLRAAIDAVLAGRPAPEPQKPSVGCNIKWKPGNDPAYA